MAAAMASERNDGSFTLDLSHEDGAIFLITKPASEASGVTKMELYPFPKEGV